MNTSVIEPEIAGRGWSLGRVLADTEEIGSDGRYTIDIRPRRLRKVHRTSDELAKTATYVDWLIQGSMTWSFNEPIESRSTIVDIDVLLPADPLPAPSADAEKDELLTLIRSLEAPSKTRQGIESPTKEAISDAFTVANLWPADLILPELEVDPDGTIILEVYDDEGFAVGGLDFVGHNHQAVYSVVDRVRVVDKGRLDTSSVTQLLGLFAVIRREVAVERPR